MSTGSPATLVDALRAAAATDRGIVLVDGEERERRRSYAELLEGATSRAAALRARGLRPGERVVVILDSSFALVETLFGVMLAGGVPAPAYPPVAMARLRSYVELVRHIVDATEARFVVTDATIARTLGAVRAARQLRDILDVTTLRADGDPRHEPTASDLGLVQCTSGSTSAPKPVALRHAHLVANVRGMHRRIGWAPSDVTVVWLPLYHDLGLIGALFGSVAAESELVLMSPATFIMNPGAWWRALDRHRGTITAAPSFAYGLSERRTTAEEVAALDLSSVRVLLCGAEPIHPETIEAFLEAFAPAALDPRVFMPAYGLAESCVGVTSADPGEGLVTEWVAKDALGRASSPRAEPRAGGADGAIRTVSVGRPVEGTELSVRDAEGRTLPDRHVGEVFVRGSSVMEGYLNHPEETREAVDPEGWLRTGDLGYQVDGSLFVVGRRKHVLIVRGRNFAAETIEAAVEAVEGVRRGNAVVFGGFDERRATDVIYVALESRRRDEKAQLALKDAVADAVREECGLSPRAIYVLPPNTLPKTSSGKKQRGAVRAMMDRGELERPPSTAEVRWRAFVTLARSQLGHLTATPGWKGAVLRRVRTFARRRR